MCLHTPVKPDPWRHLKRAWLLFSFIYFPIRATKQARLFKIRNESGLRWTFEALAAIGSMATGIGSVGFYRIVTESPTRASSFVFCFGGILAFIICFIGFLATLSRSHSAD